MVINDVKIKEKFNKAKEYIILIKKITNSSYVEFSKSFEQHVLAERAFEVLTQIMLDVCTHIISMSEISAPASYSDCMIKLSSLNILNTEESSNYSQLIKMRNIIVHQYDSINYSILFDSLTELVDNFNAFQTKILNWVEKKDVKEN